MCTQLVAFLVSIVACLALQAQETETTGTLRGLPGIDYAIVGWDYDPSEPGGPRPIYGEQYRPPPPLPFGLRDLTSVAMIQKDYQDIEYAALGIDGRIIQWSSNQSPAVVASDCRWLGGFYGTFAAIKSDGELLVGTNLSTAVSPFRGQRVLSAAISPGIASYGTRDIWAVTEDGGLFGTQMFPSSYVPRIRLPPQPITNAVSVVHGGGKFCVLLNNGSVVFQPDSPVGDQPDRLTGIQHIWGGATRVFLLHTNGILETYGSAGWSREPLPPEAEIRQIVETESYLLLLLSTGNVLWRDFGDPVRPLNVESLTHASSIASFKGQTLAVVQQPKEPPHIVQIYSRKAVPGHPVEIETTGTGVEPISLQWYRDQTLIPDATNSVLRIAPFQKELAGSYFLRACSPFGCSTSLAVQVESLEPETPRIWTVATTDSSGPGSLRELIQDANSCGSATLIMTNLTGETFFTRELPAIRSNIEIRGPGTNQFRLTGSNVVNALRIESGASCRIWDLKLEGFNTTSNIHAAIENRGNLELFGCVLSGNGRLSLGGAVHSSGNLVMSNCIVDKNYILQPSNPLAGSGVGIVGGLFRAYACAFMRNESYGTRVKGSAISLQGGQCVLDDCVIRSNRTSSVSIGLVSDNDAVGAGFSMSEGSVLLRRCSVVDNQTRAQDGVPCGRGGCSAGGGSVYGGGVLILGGDARFDSCTIARNQIHAGKGVGSPSSGGVAIGAGLYISNAIVGMINCSVYSNRAEANLGNDSISNLYFCEPGSGAYGGGIAAEACDLDLTHCTVTHNEALGGHSGNFSYCQGLGLSVDPRGEGLGGGICSIPHSFPGIYDARIHLLNSIVALNTGGPRNDVSSHDIQGPIVSRGNNLVGITNGATGFTSGDLWGVDPELQLVPGAIAGVPLYGPRATSAAIDAGSSAGDLPFDQLGHSRPNGLGVDIGAIESTTSSLSRPPRIFAAPQSVSVGTLGQPVSLGVAAGGSPPLYCQWELNGRVLPDETNLFLMLPSPTKYQEGSYALLITNAFGAARLSPVQLRLSPPTPQILSSSVRLPGVNYFQQLCYGNGRFVATAVIPYSQTKGGPSISAILTSSNGIDWSSSLLLPGYAADRVLFSEGWFLTRLYAVDSRISACNCTRLAISPNGHDWSIRDLPYTNIVSLVMSVPGGFLGTAPRCCGSNDLVWISTNLDLEITDLGAGAAPQQGAMSQGVYLLRSNAGTQYRSTDKTNWIAAESTFPSPHAFLDLISWRTGFASLENFYTNRAILFSEDSTNWTMLTTSTNEWSQLSGGVSGLGVLHGGYAMPGISVSTNGLQWDAIVWDTIRSGTPPSQLYDLTYAEGRWVAVGSPGSVLLTPNLEKPELSVSVQGPGIVSVDPESSGLRFGQSFTLVAIPQPWGRFVRWSDWVTNNPRTEVASSVNDYTALFAATTPLETLTIGGVSREGPAGKPAIILDGDLELDSSVTKISQTELRFYSSLSNAPMTWTSDGSTPSPSSRSAYQGIVLRQSAVIRVVVFPNGSPPLEGDPLAVTIQPGYRIEISNPGGGFVRLIPSAESYLPGTQVRVEITPWLGWTFMGWSDAVPEVTPPLLLTMNRDYRLSPVFGAPLLVSKEYGRGQVVKEPDAALYPYGTQVLLTGTPDSGFLNPVWSTVLENSYVYLRQNPLLWTFTNSDPRLSVRFYDRTTERVLRVSISGGGRVSTDPNTNLFQSDALVRLHADPNPGQRFLGWTGDIESVDADVELLMDQDKKVIATFSRSPQLSVEWDPAEPGILELTLQSDLGATFVLESRTEFSAWTPLYSLTNRLGVVRVREPLKGLDSYRWYRARSH